MKITMEFKGLDELQRKMEELASSSEITKTNKKIYQKAADITKPVMEHNMARSGNNARSGRKGYRPPGHAADNIPLKVTTKKGVVGWEKLTDAADFFYMKFVEWGTTKQPPQDFIYNTLSETNGKYGEIAEQEYKALLSSKLKG